MKQVEFIGETITVDTGAPPLAWPQALTWRGRTYRVTEVIRNWHDWGFGKTPLRRKTWRMRRHRTCFLVKTSENEIFEIYYDRGTKAGAPRTWILLTKEMETQDVDGKSA